MALSRSLGQHTASRMVKTNGTFPRKGKCNRFRKRSIKLSRFRGTPPRVSASPGVGDLPQWDKALPCPSERSSDPFAVQENVISSLSNPDAAHLRKAHFGGLHASRHHAQDSVENL